MNIPQAIEVLDTLTASLVDASTHHGDGEELEVAGKIAECLELVKQELVNLKRDNSAQVKLVNMLQGENDTLQEDLDDANARIEELEADLERALDF